MQRTSRYHFAGCESCPGLGLERSRQQAKSRTDGCSHLGNDLHLQVSPRAEPTRNTLHNNLETLVPPHFQPKVAQEFVMTAQGNLSIRIKVTQKKESESEVMSDCDPMDCSPPGSSIHGILQARTLEWVAISFSRGSSQPRDRTQVSRVIGRCFTI